MHNSELCLIRVHADDRISCRDKFFSFAVDVFELLVAHVSWGRIFIAGFQTLVVDAQREAHVFQKAANSLGADPDV